MITLNDLRDKLLTVTQNVFHFWATKKVDKYIVWAEDGENSTYADDSRSSLIVTGTVDYFTKTANDKNVSKIEAAMSEIKSFSFEMNSIQYEVDTGFIHYEWRWEGVVEKWQE